MKYKLQILTLLSLLLFSLPITSVQAQSASDVVWTSSISYFSTGDESGVISIIFYDGTTQYTSSSIEVEPKGSGEINIGSTTLSSDFKGSAVLSSSVPVATVTTQFAKTSPSNYSKAFYSGFDISEAGEKFYLATVRSNGITDSTIGVQNVETFEITATLNFFDRFTQTLAFSYVVDLPSNAAYIARLPEVPTYPGGYFDGSLEITATMKSDPGTPARVVASAVETQDSGRGVYSYKGTKEGADTFYLPTAMCNYFGQTSYFAIQNIGDESATVIVDYYNKSAELVGSSPVKLILPGAKWSTNPCDFNLLSSTLGSAVVRSTNSVPLIGMGKVSSASGLITAFNGLSSGSTDLAAAYVRWAADPATNYRSFIAVMNLGTEAATNVVANYYDANGNLIASHQLASIAHPLAPFTKVNTTPDSAGATINGSFGYDGNGGAVEIISDQPISAVVRNAIYPTHISGIEIFGEDYIAVNALP